MTCNLEGHGEFAVCGEKHIDFVSLKPDGEPFWPDAPLWSVSAFSFVVIACSLCCDANAR